MPKLNLILVHSFPTNSIILHGLIEYLSDFFNVYFIDLPGFTRRSKPLSKHTVESYSKYLDKRIKRLNLKKFLVGGVSFGYLVVNNIKEDKNCIGIMAMEPFLGMEYHNLKKSNIIYLKALLTIITALKAEKFVWSLMRFWTELSNKRFLSKGIGPSADLGLLTLNAMSPKMFFNLGLYLLKDDYKKYLKFKDLPYVLAINPGDTTINSKAVIKYFKENKKDLLIMKSTIEHYPSDLSKNYFAKNMKRVEVNKAIKWILKSNKMHK